MAIVTYPLNLPQPTSISYSPSSAGEAVTKMASGRRRIRTLFPGALAEGEIGWVFLPEEYRLFMGWWTHILARGSHKIQFDDGSPMVVDVGLRIIMLKTNTLTAPANTDFRIEVKSGFYGIQEV